MQPDYGWNRGRMSGRLAAVLAAGVLFAAVPAQAQGFTSADKSFVDHAFALNTTAIARAHVAASSADTNVLQYTEAIIGDRNAANDQLQAVAQSAGYRSPNAPRPEMAAPTARPASQNQNANAKSLQAGYSAVSYFEKEVAANTAAVALYKAEAQHGADAALRTYAKNFLPKMQGELTNASHLLSVERSLHAQH
jgi:predicted outer membrane protein